MRVGVVAFSDAPDAVQAPSAGPRRGRDGDRRPGRRRRHRHRRSAPGRARHAHARTARNGRRASRPRSCCSPTARRPPAATRSRWRETARRLADPDLHRQPRHARRRPCRTRASAARSPRDPDPGDARSGSPRPRTAVPSPPRTSKSCRPIYKALGSQLGTKKQRREITAGFAIGGVAAAARRGRGVRALDRPAALAAAAFSRISKTDRKNVRGPQPEWSTRVTKTIDRRQALAVFGTVSLGGMLAACGDDDGGGARSRRPTGPRPLSSRRHDVRVAADLFDQSASCSLTPEETEGPYYFDVDPIRSDIREDREGVALRLALRVRNADPASRSRTPSWTSGIATRSAPTPASSPASDWGGGQAAAAARATTDLPARRPGHERRRHRRVQDALSRLVPGPHRAHPREGAHRQPDRPHDTALLRRARQRGRVQAAVLPEHRARRLQRQRRHLRRGAGLTARKDGDGFLGS